MKTIDEIYSDMMRVFSAETGLPAQGGGDLAVRLYAVASQVHALYVQSDWVKRQCFPQTAGEEHLDLHAQLRGLERRPATVAEGVIRFEVDAAADTARVIPAGTVCMTAGLVRVETTEEATLAVGQTWAEAKARAAESGAAGNVAAGAIRSMAVAPVGISRCANPLPFVGGADREGDEDLRARVLETYRRLANGANAAYYEQEAMRFDQVVTAVVIPRARGVGTVDVVVATAAGMPSAPLLQTLTNHFAKCREIATDVVVRAPKTAHTDVRLKLKVKVGYDEAGIRAEVEGRIRGYFTGRRLGRGILVAEVAALVNGVEGVDNYKIDAPFVDIVMEQDRLIMLSQLAVGVLA